MTFVVLITILAALEITLVVTVRRLRRRFQWLITEADDIPTLEATALRKFLETSFDADLGWVRRPLTSGVEKGKCGEIIFHIDEHGARRAPHTGKPVVIGCFGDSYVFCRQVADDETWEAELSRRLGLGVANYGVGNYGADQALLRYERTKLPPTVRVAVLGFVPETICRVQSVWKHYLEFGNTFAFKPRFTFGPDGALALLPNPVRGADDFARLADILPRVRETDGFYRRKFRALQFRLPYMLSFLRHPVRHSGLLATLAGGRAKEASAFALIMARNIRDAHAMYREPEATRLLTAILQRFKASAEARGHLPLVLVLPQLLDLEANANGPAVYESYFSELGALMAVLDVTGAVRRASAEAYVEDRYGGHFSAHGNCIVAGEIAAWMRARNVFQGESATA
jgi:hypothetical protein